MSGARIEMDAVILPNGKILALGGSSTDENESTATFTADPFAADGGSKSAASANSVPRVYHSVALLLPDATVWGSGKRHHLFGERNPIEWIRRQCGFERERTTVGSNCQLQSNFNQRIGIVNTDNQYSELDTGRFLSDHDYGHQRDDHAHLGGHSGCHRST
jgi:hypothetical protein